jgi:OOP family OmpA-OmpF porin
MTKNIQGKNILGLGVLAATLAFTGAAQAQQTVVQGMIIGRDGPKMYVRTGDHQRQIVILSDSTKAKQKGGGFLGLSHKELGIAALVPGLEVKVDGSFDGDHQLLAKDVEFSRSSMRTAKQIDAGLNPVNEQMAQAQDKLRSDRRDINSSQQDIAANAQIEGQHYGENKQAIGQTNSRIGELDQYDTKDTITVNFANGKTVVSKQDKAQLEDFVKTAASTPGYMIQVQGYASKTGSAAMNQRLSSERADAVLAIIQQSGSVPMTRILAPAAMGTAEQVGDNHTRAGQKENRRVVVTVLVNKGITGGADHSAPAATPDPSAAPSN